MNKEEGRPDGMMYYYCIICSSTVSTYVEVFSSLISFSQRSILSRISITVTLASREQLNRGVQRE